LTHYVEIDLLIEEIDSDRVIEADSLVDLLIEEIDSDRVIEADSLVDTETRGRSIH